MGWLNDLAEMYDACESVVAKIQEEQPILLPIAHSTQNAQIELVIYPNGEFKRACAVEKADAVTVIPVTDDSSSRSSGPMPHPLCDKLEYIAGDYFVFVENKKKKDDKEETTKYDLYIAQLEQWANDPEACSAVKAIYQYLSKKTVMIDLIKANVLQTDENGQLTEVKMQESKQADAFVRFAIEEVGEPTFRVYQERAVFDNYIAYYLKQPRRIDYCYATGEFVPCADKHPSKIRNTGDKTKLISSNDASGFTFRGRFEKSEQAASIGYEASQKAHNALRWLVARQGFRCDELTLVAWQNDNSTITQPVEGTKSFWDAWEPTTIKEASTGKTYATWLKDAIQFQKRELKGAEMVDVLGLEGATGSNGRLSITFYQKLLATEYYNHLEEWYRDCAWWQSYFPQKENMTEKSQMITCIGTPSAWEIVTAVCGSETSDKVKKSNMQRLIPCIVEGGTIPQDMVKRIFNRVCHPKSFDGDFAYRRTLEIACALIRKHEKDKKENQDKEAIDMALEEKNTDRSYLFGRLLATAQVIEEKALYLAKEKRETNAQRLITQFRQKPFYTWRILEEKLQPYIARVNSNARMKNQKENYLVSQINEISNLFTSNDFMKNEPLSEVFLLSYHSQLYTYNHYKSNNEEENA